MLIVIVQTALFMSTLIYARMNDEKAEYDNADLINCNVPNETTIKQLEFNLSTERTDINQPNFIKRKNRYR